MSPETLIVSSAAFAVLAHLCSSRVRRALRNAASARRIQRAQRRATMRNARRVAAFAFRVGYPPPAALSVAANHAGQGIARKGGAR